MISTILPTELEQWRRNGYLKIPSFLNGAEVVELDSWAREIDSWPADQEKWMHHYEQTVHGVRLARTEYVIAFHLGISQLLTKGKVPDVAGQLMGEPAVLFKEKFNYKYPGGGGYSAHQDAPAYDFGKSHITCAIAIDEATKANGCLYFAAGFHLQGILPTNEVGCIAETVAKDLDWEPILMQPGDAIYFSSFAPHKSAPNQSDRPRRNLYLTYNALSDGDFREVYYSDKREALRKAATGSDSKVRLSKVGHFNGKPVLENQN